MSYVGIPPFGQTIRSITEQVATASQTVFTVVGGYLPGYIDIEINGQPLRQSDFTATNGTTVTMSVACSANDEVTFTAYWPVSLVDTYRKSEADSKFVDVTGDTMTGPLTINGAIVNANANWGAYVQPKSGSSLGAFNVTDPTGNYSLLNINYAGNAAPLGNIVLANGKGIDFSAGSNAAGMTGEVLDDYETGTWTPSWAATSGSVSSYSRQQGHYVRVGNWVVATCHIIINGSHTLSGAIRCNGLPFTSAAAGYTPAAMHAEMINLGASAWIWGHVAPGDSSIYVRYWNNNSAAGSISGSNMTTGADVMFTVSYRAN